MRALILTVALMGLSSCAELDKIFTPNAETGTSPAQAQVQVARDTGTLPDPWGEIALAAVIGIQNVYLGLRKVQTSRAARKAAKLA